MLDLTKDIQAMTTFRRNPTAFMKHLEDTGRPLVLTVDGKAKLIVQDTEAYQRLLDLAAEASAEEGIRQGLEDMKNGRSRPAQEVFDEIRAEYDLPR